MRIPDLWRTTRFRLTVLHGALFAVALAVLLGLIYWQTAGYLSRQVDQILRVEASAFQGVDAEALPGRIRQEINGDPRHVDLYGLFSSDGVWITGNVESLPRGMPIDGQPHELQAQGGIPPDARALGERLPWGEILIVGRDVTQLAEVRWIILRALLWSGALVTVIGLAGATVLSVPPLRRIRAVQEASTAIMRGNLAVRLPNAGRRDELDMLAAIVNTMMDEIQGLMADAKSVGDSIAHDLRTPLTRLRLLLHRVQQESHLPAHHRAALDEALSEADALLSRFHALMRISEIDNQRRRAGFANVDLRAIVEQAKTLYEPLAEDCGLTLDTIAEARGEISADAELLFEALSNLIDNAIKFTPAGGHIVLRLSRTVDGLLLEVIDDGPGIESAERGLAVQRFYRSQRDQRSPGAGLGLSIVAAITRLHAFTLTLEDAGPGLRVALQCWPKVLNYQGGVRLV